MQIETSKNKFPLSVAHKLAMNICYKLQPYCDEINIAGSIRRGKPEVKDIEIVCVPKKSCQDSLFDEGTRFYMVSSFFVKTITELGTVIKGKPTGKYMQIHLPEGINLDLFMTDDFDYYRQYAIRTGSADYVAKVIATGWKRKGWCGSDKGLRKRSDCIETKMPDGKSKWKCINPDPELPPVWKCEEDFFNWINVKWVYPSQRND